MSEEEGTLELDGAEMSLLDLANVDISQVDEVRSSRTPKGKWHFKVKELKLESATVGQENRKCAVVIAEFEIMDGRVVDESIDVNDWIGKSHFERFFIGASEKNNPLEDIGRIKAFIADIGSSSTGGSFQEMLDSAAGLEFWAPVTHKPNKNDPDEPYANISKKKKDIQVLQGEEAAA